MSIRLPLQTVLDKSFTAALPGAESVAGVVVQSFLLPQDTDNVVMKVYQASISGTGTVSVLWQTSDDGGSTWFDVTRTASFPGNSQPTSISSGTAHWPSIPIQGLGVRTTVSGVATTSASVLTQVSILSVTGPSAASTLAVGQVSGLPILGVVNRVCLIYSGAVTTNDGVKVKVLANSQSPI